MTNIRARLGRILTRPWARLRGMGQLMEAAREYEAGDITFDELKERVGAMKFKAHASRVDRPDDFWEAQAHTQETWGAPTENTLREFNTLYASRILTEEQYRELRQVVRDTAQAGSSPG